MSSFPCVQNNGGACESFLYPILPNTIREARYQSDIRVNLSSFTIPTGTHFSSAPSYQSQGWSVSVHSEGKCYAHNQTEAGFSLVTEAHVSDPIVAESLEEWVDLIRALATENDVHLLETTDLFLEVDGNAGTCSYWFADHAHRKIFWVHPADTAAVGLPNACSNAHLQFALEENYWAHVEMFPATASQYTLPALNELQVILLNARADALTSDVPTFPYTAEENERFINLLELSKQHGPNPFVMTYVARLWGIVANHRFFTHFGEGHCRMSSTHSVLKAPERKHSHILTAVSRALFDIPIQHQARLENLWVDEINYASAWRKYVSERIEDLKLHMIWLFALAIINILTLPYVYYTALNTSSMVLCTLGLCIGYVLLQEQRQLNGTGAATGAVYLDTRNTSYGFQPTAIVHSLPQAVFVWASLLFTIQGFCMAFGDIPGTVLLPIVLPVAVVLIIASFGIWVALHPRERSFGEVTPTSTQTFPTEMKDVPSVESIV